MLTVPDYDGTALSACIEQKSQRQRLLNVTEYAPCRKMRAGLFAAAKALGVSAIHSGHDHDNNYEGVLQGVRLAYGHKTGARFGSLCSLFSVFF
jgi:hypothetical protein